MANLNVVSSSILNLALKSQTLFSAPLSLCPPAPDSHSHPHDIHTEVVLQDLSIWLSRRLPGDDVTNLIDLDPANVWKCHGNSIASIIKLGCPNTTKHTDIKIAQIGLPTKCNWPERLADLSCRRGTISFD